MERVEDTKPRLPRSIRHAQQMRHTTIRRCNRLETIPKPASLGNEVVVLGYTRCGDSLLMGRTCRAVTNVVEKGPG